MISIREMTSSDIHYLFDIDTKSSDDAYDPDTWQEMAREGCLCAVACWHGTPVAFAVWRRDENRVHIERIAVKPAHRGKAIGSTLMTALIEAARCAGRDAMTVRVPESIAIVDGEKSRLLKWFLSFDFVGTGITRSVREIYGRDEDAYNLQLNL